MKRNELKKRGALILALLLAFTLTACAVDANAQSTASQSGSTSQSTASRSGSVSQSTPAAQSDDTSTNTSTTQSAAAQSSTSQSAAVQSTAAVTAGGAMDASELFSKRDLTQSADLSEAVAYSVSDGKDITVTAEGVYVLSGSAKNVTVVVDAGDEDKVQLVLDGLSVTNDDSPVIYVKNADKVFVTTAEASENSLSVTGTFTADGSTNTDAVIFSRDDLILNGLGSLTISSTDNGISGKDKIKITGGVLTVSAVDHGIEANDGIALSDGTVTVTSRQKDGLHAENEDDSREGWIYICGGTLNVTVADDGLHAVSIVQIDGGSISITAAEGIEGTWVQINDGDITISASDDGINGARKSSAYTTCVEINGGGLSITMGQGDTDGIDSNGNLTITGGTIRVNAQSPFDYDGTLTHTGGTIIVNGTETDQITNQFGGMGGGMGGGPGRRG
jgi:hypothetical protein